MGSIELPKMESVDRILKGQVEGESPALHNACYSVIGREGESNRLDTSRTGGNTVSNDDQAGTLYSAAYGSRDLARTQPVTQDSFFWIASLTKLFTAVASMIAVEKGLVTLDQNVREFVPELADLEVLEGFDDDGKPRLRKTTAPISLR